MQEHYIGAVELDRCPACFGMWFDWDELRQVVGRPVEIELMDGHTTRRCAFCRITLHTALLPGAVPAETCTACRGIFLDSDDLKELKIIKRPAGRSKPALPKADTEPEVPVSRVNTFACAKCGLTYPLPEGHGTAHGLMCRQCAPQPHPGRTARTVSRVTFLDLLGRFR